VIKKKEEGDVGAKAIYFNEKQITQLPSSLYENLIFLTQGIFLSWAGAFQWVTPCI